MEGPGLSLFQGSDSFQLKLSASEQRQEEEEAFEDQQRRNKELGNLLTNAFDDLIDDDDDGSSIVSDESRIHHASGGGDSFLSVGAHSNASRGGHSSVSDHYKHCYRTSPQVAEDHTASQAHEAVAEAGMTTNGNNDISVDQLHVLYDVRVREVQRMAEQVDKWKRQVALTAAESARLKATVEHQAGAIGTANMRVQDLEAEVSTLKQNALNAENSKKAAARELKMSQQTSVDLQSRIDTLQSLLDSFHRGTLNETYQNEVKALREELDVAAKNYVLKSVELDRLTLKMAEVQQEHKVILVEKAKTIDTLNSNLRASQRQLQQLSQSGGSGAAELGELNMKLKEELERCIAGGKQKVEETKQLQELLDHRDEAIQSMTEKSTLLYNECQRFESENLKLASLNEELEAVRQQLIQQLETAETNRQQLSERLQAAEAGKPPSVVEVQHLRNRLEAALEENEKVKQSYIDVCESKASVVAELTSLMAQRGLHGHHSSVDNATNTVDKLTTASENLSNEVNKSTSGVERISNGSKNDISGVERGTKDGVKHVVNGVDKNVSLQEKKLQEASAPHYSESDLLEAERIKLRRAYEVKMRETEELIKEETIKLFADELEALEGKRDAAMKQLEVMEERAKRSDKTVEELVMQMEALRKDFDIKVVELQEAARRFDEFQANSSEAFACLKAKYQKKRDKETAKYKKARKEADKCKRSAEAKEQYMIKQFTVMENSYQSALMKVQQKIEILLRIKDGEREL